MFREQFCQVDPKTMAVGMGPGRLAELLSFMSAGKPGLASDPQIAGAAENLPKSANMYWFVNIGNMVRQQAATMPPEAMMMMGMFMQLQGVIAGSVTLENGAVHADLFIPNEPIKLIGSIATQFMMMSQQMGQGGMPPGGMQPMTPPNTAPAPAR